ncbi:putative protoporphyrinogen oxidase [Oscillochloris trichoides DG-6]|uniref:Protoporphyrinogen oxidase n=1 Tax=Oscillochloris trichoides DG-6 TaxID=765420 RepID=E1IC38_9CHLR|nr:FAD-dependent oxidoreductase [Oscillochloris trichoides]EFO81228.1 putative protoporphyrinogen oxidase [Oscillochloris trichoides DG-6]
MATDRTAIVIGAGLAGLAAARRLQAHGLRVIVLEAEPTLGGRARTVLVQGSQIELGAEFLASFYTRTMALIDELGLRADLCHIPSSSAILRNGRFYSLWANARVVLTPLVGVAQKLSLAYMLASLLRHGTQLDLHAFQKAYPLDDCSVSAYARAHFSEEVLEYLLQPPLAGIFYWTPERTSRALLMLVLRAGLSQLTGLRLYTLREGIGQLPRRMAEGLDVRLESRVEAVEYQPGGGYLVRVAGAPALRCERLICATTASSVAHLFPWLEPAALDFFRGVRYSSTALLATGLHGRLPRTFYGLLFPRRESPFLASATVQAVKSVFATPQGCDTLALHMSGPAMAALHTYDDQTLTRVMLSELRRVAPQYDPGARATFQRLYRCPEALPEFDVGHFHHLHRLAEHPPGPPGLGFAGDYLGGPYVEGAILSGEAAAAHVLG